MALVCVLWLAGVGMADDWLKLTAGRRNNSRQGLTSLEKLLFQIGLGMVLSYFTFQHGQHVEDAHTLYFPFFKNLKVSMNQTGFILVGTVVLTGRIDGVEQRRQPHRWPGWSGGGDHGDRELRVPVPLADRGPTAGGQEAADSAH
jgi:hypothetical protein